MIIRSTLTRSLINSIKLGEEITLELSNSSKPKEVTKVVVKVSNFIKDPIKCTGCGIKLDKIYLVRYRGKPYCLDCKNRRLEAASLVNLGHKRALHAFGMGRK
jgi:hypothetical protein